jgi:tripartite-type tricarboxylate transporter receptor subunit TctC
MKRRNSRVWLSFSACVVGLTLLIGVSVSRAEYPDRPVTIVVPSGPGGPLDLIARAIALGAEKPLGQSIVVDNKPGGGGTVGLSVVAAAKPDGYTLCAASTTPMIRAPLLQKVPFKPLGSFTPILGFALPHSAIVVKTGAPWTSLQELVEYAKKNPGKIKYSSSGLGSAMHHAMEVVALKEGIKWVHVPYQGPAPALTALLGGHVDVCSSGADFLPQARSGTVRVLATNGEKRLAALPEVPTLKELGYDFVDETVFSIVGPAGLPRDITSKLETAFSASMEAHPFRSTTATLDLVPISLKSEEYSRYLKDLWFRLEKSLRETGLIKEAATRPN